MFLIVAGLVVSFIGAIISTLSSDSKTPIKVALTIITLVGGIVAYVSARNEQKSAEEREQQAKQRAVHAEEELARLTSTLDLVRFTVGDLAKLNDLSGGAQYYVRIAADNSRERLEKFLDRIENQFKGARSSGLVAIRDPRKGSTLYELVFGQHLDLASAEVFHRLATSHKFAPEGDVAAIRAE